MTDAERIEQAMYATANRLGGGTLQWSDDWVQLTTPEADTDYRNIVYRSVLADDEVDARVSEVIDQHRALGAGFRWWVTPSTRPRDMGSRLLARGFEHIDDVEGMVADAGGFPEPAAGDVEVLRIGLDEADTWVETTGEGWDMPAAGRARFGVEVRNVLADPDSRSHYFLARLDGVPAGTCALTLVDDFAHFSGSVVIPEYRRRGAYRAMILERMRFVRARGMRHVTNTCVKSTSAPICAKLGFRKVFDSQIYVHAGGG